MKPKKDIQKPRNSNINKITQYNVIELIAAIAARNIAEQMTRKIFDSIKLRKKVAIEIFSEIRNIKTEDKKFGSLYFWNKLSEIERKYLGDEK